MAGGVIGAQLGTRASAKFPGEQLRSMLALIVLGVCARLAYELLVRPDDLFTIGAVVGHG